MKKTIQWKGGTSSGIYVQLLPLDNTYNTHYIGLGHAGKRVLDKLYMLDTSAAYTVVTLPPGTPVAEGGCAIQYVRQPEEGRPEGGRLYPGTDHTHCCIDMDKTLGEYEHYVLVASISGRTGRVLLEACIDYFTKKGKPFSVIAICPFGFESNIAFRLAIDFINCYKSLENIYYYSNDSIKKDYSHLPVGIALDKANEEIAEMWMNAKVA